MGTDSKRVNGFGNAIAISVVSPFPFSIRSSPTSASSSSPCHPSSPVAGTAEASRAGKPRGSGGAVAMDMVLQLEVVIVRQSLNDVTLDSSKGERGLCSKSWNLKTLARGHVDCILYFLFRSFFCPHVHFFTFRVLREGFTDQTLLSYSSSYINGDILRTSRTRCIYSRCPICLPLVLHRSPSVPMLIV